MKSPHLRASTLSSLLLFLLAAAAFAACVVDGDATETDAKSEAAPSDQLGAVELNPLYQSNDTGANNPLFGLNADLPAPVPFGEEIWWRCSTTQIPYPTRTFCQSACAGGTCRIALVCTDDGTGQQIPCP